MPVGFNREVPIDIRHGVMMTSCDIMRTGEGTLNNKNGSTYSIPVYEWAAVAIAETVAEAIITVPAAADIHMMLEQLKFSQ